MVRVAVTALVTALLVPASVAPLPAEGTLPQPTIRIEAAEPAQLEMAMWAVGRFEEAGFVPPDLKIIFPGRDLNLCKGAPATALT